MTPKSVENAMRVLLALGGSTNAIIHLAAIAGRLGLSRRPRTTERAERDDAGAGGPEADRHGYMEDLHAAGGVPAVLRELRPSSTSIA